MKKFLYLNRRAPHGSIYAQEALEVVLMGAAFDQEVTVVFLDDGVFQLKRDQDTRSTGAKNFSPTYRALKMYDVKRVVVERESLARRGLAPADLLIEVETLSGEEIGALMDHHDVVLSF